MLRGGEGDITRRMWARMTGSRITDAEAAALKRWAPGERFYHPLMARVVIATSRFITVRLNELEVVGRELLDEARLRRSGGLLTISNHVSLFDDPLLIANFVSGPYRDIRWVGADAINFFGSPLKSWLFTAGKSVPIVRGAGIQQPGMDFLRDRLLDGEWVHMFPEGGRTRDPNSLMSDFHPGVGWLVSETRPLVLPFYHYGMQNVLPVGSIRPRGGNVVKVWFGDTIECDEDWVASFTERAGTHLWHAIAGRLQEKVRKLEGKVNPLATAEGIINA